MLVQNASNKEISMIFYVLLRRQDWELFAGKGHDKQKYLVSRNKSSQKPHIRVLIVSSIIIWAQDDLQRRGASIRPSE